MNLYRICVRYETENTQTGNYMRIARIPVTGDFIWTNSGLARVVRVELIPFSYEGNDFDSEEIAANVFVDLVDKRGARIALPLSTPTKTTANNPRK